MAIVIEAPNELYSLQSESNTKLFLAGDITDCPDWQSKVIEGLSSVDNLTIFNPRRTNWDINDSSAIEKQTIWEFRKIKESNVIAFWFSKGSLNPITLYELGYWIGKKPVVIGIDKEYQKREQVILQSKLAGYEDDFTNNIEDHVESIKRILYF
jgi:hypothetical protein